MDNRNSRGRRPWAAASLRPIIVYVAAASVPASKCAHFRVPVYHLHHLIQRRNSNRPSRGFSAWLAYSGRRDGENILRGKSSQPADALSVLFGVS